jgi:hypothetical protein
VYSFFIYGQQKEARRELAKEELNSIADSKSKSEILALVTKLFPAATTQAATHYF